MFHILYQTTCNVTGNFYVGMHSTEKIEDGFLGSGKRLRNSLKKHGRENHTRTILEFCKDETHLRERERAVVSDEFLKTKGCLNLKIGGEGGATVETLTKAANALWERYRSDPVFAKDFMERRSASRRGKAMSAESIEKMRQTKIGKRHTPETRLKMSLAHKARLAKT